MEKPNDELGYLEVFLKKEEEDANVKKQMLEKEVSKFVLEQRQKWKTNYWGRYHDICRSIDREYLAKQEMTDDNRVAKIRPSLLYTITEDVTAALHQALFDEAPYMKNQPTKGASAEVAEALDDFHSWQAYQNGTLVNAIPYVRNIVKYGFGIALLEWEEIYREKRRYEPVMEPVLEPAPIDPFTNMPMMGPNGAPMEPTPAMGPDGMPVMRPVIGPDGKQKTRVTFISEKDLDNWKFTAIENWDFVCDPSILTPMDLMTKGRGFIVDRYLTKSKIREYARDGIFKNYEEYEAHMATVNNDDDSSYSDSISKDDQHARDLNMAKSWKNGAICVHQFWGKFPCSVDEDGEPIDFDPNGAMIEVLADVSSDGFVFRLIRNPIDEQIRPVISSNCVPQADGLVGPGPVSIIFQEYQIYKEFFNSRLINLNRTMNPMYFVRMGELGNIKNLAYVPRKIVRLSDPNSIKAEDPPNLGATYGQDMGDVLMSMQNASGSMNTAQRSMNMGQAFSRTKAGIDFFEGKINQRLVALLNVIEYNTFGCLFRGVHSLNKQFLTEDKDFAALGKPNVYKTITPEAYMMQTEFRPVGAHRKLKKMEMVGLLDRIIPELKQHADVMKLDKVFKQYLKLVDIFPDLDSLFYTPEEQAQRAAEKLPERKENVSISVSAKDLPVAYQAQLYKQLEIEPDPQTIQTTNALLSPGSPAKMVLTPPSLLNDKQ